MRHPLLSLILLSLAACASSEEGRACLGVQDTGVVCPEPADVDLDTISSPDVCGVDVVEMLSTEAPESATPVFQDGSVGCCYDVVLRDKSPGSQCAVGRPYLHGGKAVLAPCDAPAVAAAWTEVGRAEHASVAAFAKLTLQLMAHGAPSDLLSRVAQAMADEVRHAEIAFGFASELAGAPVVPGPFPFPEAVQVTGSLSDLAQAAVREGCIGETLSALATRHAAETAADPEVRAALLGIADDEDRHAGLSWAIVAWAMRAGGDEVRAAVVGAFREPVPVPEGLLEAEAIRTVASAGLREVIAPAATALLAA